MDSTEIIALLEQVTNAPENSIGSKDELLTLAGWDSLTSVQFMTLLKQKHQIELSGLDIEKCKRVSDLVKLCQR